MVTPLPGPVSPPVPPPAPPLSRGEVAVRILSAPSDVTPPARLNGQITAVDRDGTVHIETDKGEVVARLPANASARTGDRVTVDLPPPPSQPGQAARPATLAPQPQEPKDVPPATEKPPATTVPPRTTNAPPPAEETLRRIAQNAQPMPPAAPEPGQVVQLKAITATTAQTLLALAVQQGEGIGTTPASTSQTTPQTAQNTAVPGLPQGLQILPASALASPTGLLQFPLGTQVLQPFPAIPGESQGFPPSASLAPGTWAGTPLAQPFPATQPSGDAEGQIVPGFPPTGPSSLQTGNGSNPAAPVLTDPFPTGGTVQAKLFSITLPPLAQMPLPQPGSLQTFIVLGPAPERQSVIQSVATPAQFALLQAPSDGLPAGTALTLDLSGQAPANRPLPALPVWQEWPAPMGGLMDDLADLMAALPPDLSASLFGAAARAPLPTPTQAPQQMGAALLFFLAAVRGGDFGGWLGERAVDTLRKGGKAGLTEKLEGTFAALRRTTTEATPGEWRSFAVPMQFDQNVKPALLHLHRDAPEKESKNKGNGQTRFVLDIGFDRLGPVQVDALYKPGRLDAILRTEAPFTATMRTELATRYAKALAHGNLTGEIHFQHGASGWVTAIPAREAFATLA